MTCNYTQNRKHGIPLPCHTLIQRVSKTYCSAMLNLAKELIPSYMPRQTAIPPAPSFKLPNIMLCPPPFDRLVLSKGYSTTYTMKPLCIPPISQCTPKRINNSFEVLEQMHLHRIQSSSVTGVECTDKSTSCHILSIQIVMSRSHTVIARPIQSSVMLLATRLNNISF